jgi:uncharacterized membrane protein
MYIWGINELSYKLKIDSLSEQAKMRQYIGLNLLLLITIFLAMDFWEDINIVLLNLSLHTIITTIGIMICYSSNSKGDGKNFLDRMICLSLPIAIRITMLNLLLIFLMSSYKFLTNVDIDLLDIVKNSILNFLFYWWLNSNIVKIAQQSNDFQVPIQ